MITNQDNIPAGVLNLARRIDQLVEPKKTVTMTITNTGDKFTVDIVRCATIEILHIDKNQ